VRQLIQPVLQPYKRPIKTSNAKVLTGQLALDLSAVKKELSSWLVQLQIAGYLLWI